MSGGNIGSPPDRTPVRTHALYLAVVPAYRRECFEFLRMTERDLTVMCSPAHLDQTVTTGLPNGTFQAVRMVRLAGRAFIQFGGWYKALRVDDLVIDLNPRSVTAWVLLLTRWLLRQRTLVWGHLYPQGGASSTTGRLRMAMRRLSSGTITYTYNSAIDARRDLPRKPVWVAPNSLYSEAKLSSPLNSRSSRTHVVYVGRFEQRKKVDLLVRGFACSGLFGQGAQLVLVGDGTERERLGVLAKNLGIGGAVRFAGWIADYEALSNIYSQAFVSGSPGFAGLGLTQSLGFGVPMIVAKGEQHSPEIELDDTGGVIWTESDDPRAFGLTLRQAWLGRSKVPITALRDSVRSRYSADAMAKGLADALRNRGGS